MNGLYKTFSKALHKENDLWGRRFTKHYFKQLGFNLINNPDKYGPDLILKGTDPIQYVEVARVRKWTKKQFPYEMVNILERKAKFFISGRVSSAIISADGSRICLMSAKDIEEWIKPKHLVEISNTMMKRHERYYQIPVRFFKFDDIR